MPELPEVETVVRDLRDRVAGCVLRRLEIRDPRVLEAASRPPALLEGARLENIGRRGKYMLLRFPGVVLVQHLRMTGRMLPRSSPLVPGDEDPRSRTQLRAIFHFVDRDGRPDPLAFVDTRRFGTLCLVADEDAYFAPRGLAPEIFAADGGVAARAHFRRALSRRNSPLKTALLDQRVIAGVGNIYADEGLHRAGLHPRRSARTLDARSADTLFDALRDVLAWAVDLRGTSMSDYLDVNGAPGVFREVLGVYRRAGLPCRQCGEAVRRELLGGRATHWCELCQPAPDGLRGARR